MTRASARSKLSRRRRSARMAHKITDECVACGACLDECSSDAIAEGDPIYIIDQEKCTDCGTCVEACPNDSIVAPKE